MAWKKLTTDDIKMILSEDEVTTLNTTSVDGHITDLVQHAIDLVADMFRGAFRAKGYAVDVRDNYVPSGYVLPVLQYARYVAWSRFPNSPDIALDEVRKEDVKRLEALLKNPYIGVEKPEWEHSSENPEVTGSSSTGSISLPFLRLDEQLIWFNNIKQYDGWTRNQLF